MSSAIGSPQWFGAWSPEQRQRTVQMARKKCRRLRAWQVVGLVGLFGAAASVVVGGPAEPTVDRMASAAASVGALGLVLVVGALELSRIGWGRVGQVFRNERPPTVLSRVRAMTGGTALSALLVGLLTGGYSALYPATGLARSDLTATDAALAVVGVAALLCGVAAIRLWVNLRPSGDQQASGGPD